MDVVINRASSWMAGIFSNSSQGQPAAISPQSSVSDFEYATGTTFDRTLMPGADFKTQLGANLLVAIYCKTLAAGKPIILNQIDFPCVPDLPFLSMLPNSIVANNCTVSGGYVLCPHGSITVTSEKAGVMGWNDQQLIAKFGKNQTLTSDADINDAARKLAVEVSLEQLEGSPLMMMTKQELERMYSVHNELVSGRPDDFSKNSVQDPSHLCNLGHYYSQLKSSTTQHKLLAAQFYEEAICNGSLDALYPLGMMYFKGDGIEQNPELASQYLSLAYYLKFGLINAKYPSSSPNTVELGEFFLMQEALTLINAKNRTGRQTFTDVQTFTCKLFGEALRQGKQADKQGLVRQQALKELENLAVFSSEGGYK